MNRNLILMLILICIITLSAQQDEGFTNFSVWASSMKDFNITEKSYAKHISPRIIYTHRYLAKYYTKLIHEWLMELEDIYYGGVKTAPKPFIVTADTERKQIWKDSEIDVLLNYLIEKLNTYPPIFDKPKFYYQKSDIVQIPINKTERTGHRGYNVLTFYQKDLDMETTQQNYIVLKLRAGKISSMGVNNLPKKYHYKGARRTVSQPAVALKEVLLGVKEEQIPDKLKQRRAFALKEKLAKCFLPDEISHSKYAGDEQSCYVLGGQWDTPCRSSAECPFYKANKNYPNSYGGCNVNTGYCQMPEGVKNLTYKKYKHKDLDKAVCYSCPDGPAGTCCKGQKNPDYKFKHDIKTRKKYKGLLESKGLNWFKY